jgi:hypothetical protein
LIIFADSCWIEKEVRDQAAWVRILVLLGTISSYREFLLEARVDDIIELDCIYCKPIQLIIATVVFYLSTELFECYCGEPTNITATV